MRIIGGTLSRYFGLHFLATVLIVFAGFFLLVAMIDYIELSRRATGMENISAAYVAKTSIYRVPQVTERIMPFCVLIGAMSCFLNLSRRHEFIIARTAGMSAWQFIAPALVVAFLLGIAATTIYNPVSAVLQERAKRLEAEMFGARPSALRQESGTFWVRQRSRDGEDIVNARSSSQQGIQLNGVTVFRFNASGNYKERIDARSATLQSGVWRLNDARIYVLGTVPINHAVFLLPTNLSPEQVRESFATPESVPFWELPLYINGAEHAGLFAVGYRLQFQKLLARPFFLATMVFIAAAVGLRFFRFGGVQRMILYGVAAGFLLYVLSQVTADLSNAQLLHPVAAAWMPPVVGSLTGFMALLYQEDG